MRLRHVVPALSIAALSATSALAQDAVEAGLVEGFLTDAALLGASEATVGSVAQDGDTVTATDARMVWESEFDTATGPVTLTATVSIPTLEVTALESSDDGNAVGRLAVPEANLSIDVTGAPDAPLSYRFTLRDYVLENASWGTFPAIEADPERPVSRFAPLIDWSLRQSYERNSVGRIEGVVSTPDGDQELGYGPLEFGPVSEGRIDSLSYPEIVSQQTSDMPDAEGNPVPTTMVIRYGPITATDIDLTAMAAALTGTGAEQPLPPVIGNLVIEAVALTAENGLEVTTGRIVQEGFGFDPSRGPLLEKLDPIVAAAMAGTEPDPAALMDFVFDLYGAYRIGLYSVSGLQATAPDFQAGVGEILLEDLGRDGLGRIAVNGMQVNAMNGSGQLGGFEIASVGFPARAAVESVIQSTMMGLEPTPPQILAALPTVGRITVAGFELNAAGVGTVGLGRFELGLGSYIGAIPTALSVTLDGLVMPAALIPDPNTAMMAQAIGADPVEANALVDIRWDEGAQRLEWREDARIASVGRILSSAVVTGVPRVIFEDPSRAQEAAATAAVGNLQIRFEDEGLTSFALNMIASQSGVTAADFAAGLAQQAELQIGALTGNAALGREVANAVGTFLNDPRNLTITVAPANPVPVMQIAGAAMTAPQTLPALLNFSIAANQ